MGGGEVFIFDLGNLALIACPQTAFGRQGDGVHAQRFGEGTRGSKTDEPGILSGENIRIDFLIFIT